MTTSEIADLIAEHSRVLKLGRVLPDGALPWETIEAVRDDFEKLLQHPGITIERIAECMGPGFSRGPLSRFRNARGSDDLGDETERVARGVNRFLETMARRTEAPCADGNFVETEVARRMLLVIGKTAEISAISIIFGDAGRGKSMTLKAAQAIHPGSILIRVMATTRTHSNFIKHLAAQLLLRNSQSPMTAQRRVNEKLTGTGRLLLIDEAHQLKPSALELIRDIHDETGIPIVLVGTVKLADQVADNDLFFGQLASRIALRLDLTEPMRGVGGNGPRGLHSIEEIHRLYDSDKVRLTGDAAELLAKIANLPGLGGLRLCTKIVQVAAALAQDGRVERDTLLKIMRTMQGLSHSIGLERAVEQSRIAVA